MSSPAPAADLVYCKAQTALALLDYDTKGMPGVVAAALQRCGGYWAALVAVLPALQSAARVIRRSTSAGLFRSDTGNAIARLGWAACLCRGQGRHRHRALPEDAARALLARRARLDDGRCRRPTIGALDCRSHGLRSRAPGVRGRPDPRSAAAPGPGQPQAVRDRGRGARHARGLPAADGCRDIPAARAQGEVGVPPRRRAGQGAARIHRHAGQTARRPQGHLGQARPCPR